MRADKPMALTVAKLPTNPTGLQGVGRIDFERLTGISVNTAVAAGRFLAVGLVVLILQSVGAAETEKCLFCHSSKSPKRIIFKELTLDPSIYFASVHGKKIACTDCHVGVGLTLEEHKEAKRQVDCARCHGEAPSVVPPQARNRYDSIHQIPREAGTVQVPTCKGCHGTHDIEPLSSPFSRVHKTNIRATCGKCHGNPDSPVAKKAPQTSIDYDRSIHGRRENRPGVWTATCTDCHLAHHPRAKDSTAPIEKTELPSICGKCHKSIANQYRRSIHGRALKAGMKDAPVCTDCHGEHTIRPPTEPESTVHPLHVVATCIHCHENRLILRRYGLPSARLSTYRKTYHGIANQFGDVRAAECASCHGAHDILPSTDPRSPIHPKNRPKTCGKCHQGATENFAKGTIHVAPSARSDVVVYWVSVFYRVLIACLVGAFVLMIVLDLPRRLQTAIRQRGEMHG